MRLAWHIARKDIRRMAAPVAGWLTFIVVTTVWFRLAGGGLRSGDLTILITWTRLLVALQLVMGYLLAGAAVLEDPLAGTAGFWSTRPISNRRLFGAKMIGVGLLFVLAPAIALIPVWLLCGFPAHAWLAAARDMIFWQAAVTVLAVAVASLSPTLRHFLLGSIGLAVIYSICAAYGVTASWVEPLALGVRQSRNILIQFSAVPFMAAILVHQFLTRNTRRGLLLIAAGLGLTLAVRVAWPWDIMRRFDLLAGAWPVTTRVEDPRPEVTVERMEEPAGESAPLTVRMGGGGLARGVFFAPHAGQGELRWPDGATESGLIWRSGVYAEAAARRLWAGRGEVESLPWEMVFRLTATASARLRTEPAAFRAELLLAQMSGRVVGKLPLKLGAEIASDGNCLRIVELMRDRETLTVTVEERDNATLWDGNRSHPQGHFGRAAGRAKCYLLVTAAAGVVQAPAIVDRGAVTLNGFSLSFHELTLSTPGREVDLERDAALVLVRFEPDFHFTRPLAVERLTLSPREKQP